jgi:hypothetical protein
LEGITKTNSSASDSSDGANVILWVEPQFVDKQHRFANILVQNGVLCENLDMSAKLLSARVDIGNQFVARTAYDGRHSQGKSQVHSGFGAPGNAFDYQIEGSQRTTFHSFC